jgi:hypothetical protein
MSWSSKWSFSFGLSHQNLVHFSLLSNACHMPRPPHSSWLDLPNDIWGWVQIMKFLKPLQQIIGKESMKFIGDCHIWYKIKLKTTKNKSTIHWRNLKCKKLKRSIYMYTSLLCLINCKIYFTVIFIKI